MGIVFKGVKIIHVKVLSKARDVMKVLFSNKYLLYTNITISMSSSSLGDAIDQNVDVITEKQTDFNKTRNFHMMLTGFGSGLICHTWYKFLDRMIIGDSIKIAMKKMVLDQIFISPLCIANLFFTLALLEQTSFNNALQEIYDKAWKLYVAEWVVWPPAQLINFYVIPLRFRVFFDSCISLGYDVYYAHVRHEKDDPLDDKENDR